MSKPTLSLKPSGKPWKRRCNTEAVVKHYFGDVLVVPFRKPVLREDVTIDGYGRFSAGMWTPAHTKLLSAVCRDLGLGVGFTASVVDEVARNNRGRVPHE